MRSTKLAVMLLAMGCGGEPSSAPVIDDGPVPAPAPAAAPAEQEPLGPADPVAQPTDTAALEAAAKAKAAAEAEAAAANAAAAKPADTPEPSVRDHTGTDMAKMMKDSAQAPWMAQVHKGATAGQYAVWQLAGGSKQWWGCTGYRGGNRVLEMRMAMGGQGWITFAYVVDDDQNVVEGFIANYDPAETSVCRGFKISVMEKTEPADAGDRPEPEKGEETVNAAGRDWACTWYKTEFGKTWMAEQSGWFNKIVRSTDAAGNTVMELVEIGTDARLGLAFPKSK